jgi:hypothetical protein
MGDLQSAAELPLVENFHDRLRDPCVGSAGTQDPKS